MNDKTLDNEWKQIAVNCLQLKSLKCFLFIDPNDGPINDNLFSSLKQFKSLKRLDISLRREELNQIFKDYIKSFSFKTFKGFDGLSHLAVDCYRYYIVFECLDTNETMLTDIDINLPNLKLLRLYTRRLEATQWTADILSRLSKLETIKICVEKSVQPLIESKLKKFNKYIKSIEFIEWY